jgi:uncharacterized protein YndB with AHSA1/START domain
MPGLAARALPAQGTMSMLLTSRRSLGLAALAVGLSHQSMALSQMTQNTSPTHPDTTTAQSRFSYVIYMKATPAAVWAALTNPEIQKQIWMGHYIESQWKPGAAWRMLSDDGSLANSGEVLEIDQPRGLVLSWRNEAYPDRMAEGYSHAEITLDQDMGMTKASVLHTLDRPKSTLIAAASRSWPLIFSNLKSAVESPGAA